jgi:hypothetical protein
MERQPTRAESPLALQLHPENGIKDSLNNKKSKVNPILETISDFSPHYQRKAASENFRAAQSKSDQFATLVRKETGNFFSKRFSSQQKR